MTDPAVPTDLTDPTGLTAPTARVPVSVNGDPRELPPGTTLGTLVASLTRASSGVAAAVNESVVPRSAWHTTALAGGDRVEVLTAVQGG
ncbi:sulfur carrier protein ThiS [Streptomyces sp. NPDC005576]|uniref:sulfur carrier protein ThiS n=1 Tax=Streptomyces sp. NPDC005576 TaxID=3364726 RepID=UPI00367BDC91